jgi:putative inorganic carbon (HCO3(-)) transporter
MLPIILFAALVAAAAQSLVDGVIVMPYSQVFLMLIVGWSMGWYYSTNDHASYKLAVSDKAALKMAIGTPIVAAGLFVIIVCTVFPEILHLQEREKTFAAHNGNYFSPRFWRQGWIDQ